MSKFSENVSEPSEEELKTFLIKTRGSDELYDSIKEKISMIKAGTQISNAPEYLGNKTQLHQQRYIEKQEVISNLSQEKAYFGHSACYYMGYCVNITKSFSKEVFDFLLEQLGNGTTVTKHLSFKFNVLNEQQAIQLIKLLETNETLQSLELIIDNSPAITQAIAELLKKNNHLKEIQIYCDNEGAIAFAKALKVNDSLQTLNLSGNDIENEGAIALAGALGVNSTLQELDLEYNHKITEAVLPYFCFALEANEKLRIFKIYNYNIELDDDVVDYLRSSECKYKPLGSGTKKAYPTPSPKDYSTTTEEKQDEGDNQHKLEVNHLDEQPADDCTFDFSALEEALPTAGTPGETAPLEPMGESSALYGGFCSIS